MFHMKIILFLTITSQAVFSRHYKAWEDQVNIDDYVGLLFDVEGLEDNELENEVEKFTVCRTTACQKLGEEFLKGMNKSVDPCDDFHAHVCGAWASKHPIPDYEKSYGSIEMFQFAVAERIRGLLETKPQSSDILPVRQAKKWYRSCMNTNDLEKRGIKPLESILMQTGGWPMTLDPQEWDENDHSWQNIERYYFFLTGSYIFYKVDLEMMSWGRFFSRFLKIESGDFPLSTQFPRKYRNYTGNDYASYVELIQGVVKSFVEHNKADVTDEMIAKDVKDLVEFEKKIYMSEQNLTYHFHQMTIRKFLEFYETNTTEFNSTDKLNLQAILSSAAGMGNIQIENGTKLPISLSIDVVWFQKLTKLLSETPKRTIVNYLHWHFVSNMLQYTSEKMRELLFKLDENNLGLKSRPPRWYECVQEVEMPHATAYAFVQEYFPENTEKAALEMIDYIREEMESQMTNSDWMDDEVKKIAIDKLHKMKVFIGFPDWYRNRTAVINSYKGLTVGTNFLDNILNYMKYEKRQKIRRVKGGIDDGPWNISPTIVNALYDPRANSINVPAADFQPPLFTSSLPDAVNFGMAGVIIGHEIGHAFDDHGIHYGMRGNRTGLRKQILKMYYKRAECFLDQFNEYFGVTEPIYEDSTPSNYDWNEMSAGRRTRGENIADTTGLNSVFKAYQKMSEKRKHGDSRLPGFEEYTDSQMFFISFAAMWCGIERPQVVERKKRLDEHSPRRLRVIGAVSNTNGFAKAFNCPKGSEMNPVNKCNIWKSIPNEGESPSFSMNRHHGWMRNW